MARKNEQLENELEAAKKTISRLEGVVRECETSRGAKRGTAERGSSTGSGGSLKANGSPEVRSPIRKNRKGKQDLCTLCCVVR